MTELEQERQTVRETLAHIRRVGENLSEVATELVERAVRHDRSKFSDEEWPTIAAETPRLKTLAYGSAEYRNAVNTLAATGHYLHNSHHPEHYDRGVAGMTLIDLMEMLADWEAASRRTSDGDLAESLRINRDRFKIDDQLYAVLVNTAKSLWWVDPTDDNESDNEDKDDGDRDGTVSEYPEAADGVYRHEGKFTCFKWLLKVGDRYVVMQEDGLSEGHPWGSLQNQFVAEGSWVGEEYVPRDLRWNFSRQNPPAREGVYDNPAGFGDGTECVIRLGDLSLPMQSNGTTGNVFPWTTVHDDIVADGDWRTLWTADRTAGWK